MVDDEPILRRLNAQALFLRGYLKLIRTHELELLVILTTAECPEELLDQQETLQIDAVLSKPYTFQELEAAVHQVLSSKHHHRTESAPLRRW